MTPMQSVVVLAGAAFILIVVVVITLLVFYCLTLYKALDKCSPAARTMEPWKVWLLVIPLFGLVWHFFIVLAIARSLANEYRARNLPLPEPEPGMPLGMVMAATSVCGLVPVRFLSGLISIVSLVLWGIYWVRIARYSKFLDQALLSPGMPIV